MLDIGTAIAALKLPIKNIVAICIATAILLFANDKALDTLGLKTFVAESRAFIGAAFVVSVCIISVALISAIASFAWPWLAQHSRLGLWL
jgi:hypothetical protein